MLKSFNKIFVPALAVMIFYTGCMSDNSPNPEAQEIDTKQDPLSLNPDDSTASACTAWLPWVRYKTTCESEWHCSRDTALMFYYSRTRRCNGHLDVDRKKVQGACNCGTALIPDAEEIEEGSLLRMDEQKGI